MGEECARTWEAASGMSAGNDPLGFLRMHSKKRAARFESETLMGPLLGAVSSSTQSAIASSFPPGQDSRVRWVFAQRGVRLTSRRLEVMTSTRKQLATRRAVLGEAFLNLCKASPQAREHVVAWLSLVRYRRRGQRPTNVGVLARLWSSTRTAKSPSPRPARARRTDSGSVSPLCCWRCAGRL
jgi:hypothetical protein